MAEVTYQSPRHKRYRWGQRVEVIGGCSNHVLVRFDVDGLEAYVRPSDLHYGDGES